MPPHRHSDLDRSGVPRRDHPPGPGERDFVRRLTDELSRDFEPASVPFGDDMAELGDGWLWTTDTLTEGVDFLRESCTWRQAGRKAMAANLSDCAAMGATPRAALVSMVLENTVTVEDALEILRGVRECGAEHGCSVRGGDTNSWNHPTVISITLAALTEHTLPVLRSGARPGDRVMVSGLLGGSILGRHLTFTPRVALGQTLARNPRAAAMMDISDGLAIDLARMTEASACGAILNEAGLRRAIHADAVALARRDAVPALEHALYDGEDFELLVALAPGRTAESEKLGLIDIGEFTPEPGLWLRGAAGDVRPLEVRGWEHMR